MQGQSPSPHPQYCVCGSSCHQVPPSYSGTFGTHRLWLPMEQLLGAPHFHFHLVLASVHWGWELCAPQAGRKYLKSAPRPPHLREPTARASASSSPSQSLPSHPQSQPGGSPGRRHSPTATSPNPPVCSPRTRTGSSARPVPTALVTVQMKVVFTSLSTEWMISCEPRASAEAGKTPETLQGSEGSWEGRCQQPPKTPQRVAF